MSVPDKVTVRRPTWLKEIFIIKPIIDLLKGIRRSIDTLKFPQRSSEPVSVRLSDGQKFYRALGGGRGGVVGGTGGGVMQDSILTQLQVLNSLIPTKYDAIIVSYPNAATEVYAFKTGGIKGTQVSSVTVSYTDATKEDLVAVVRA